MRASVTQIGNSTGVILPKEAVARLKVKKGDSVFLTETLGGYAITPYDPEFETQMKAARRGMAEVPVFVMRVCCHPPLPARKTRGVSSAISTTVVASIPQYPPSITRSTSCSRVWRIS